MGKSKNKFRAESGVTLRQIAYDFTVRLTEAARDLAKELRIVYLQLLQKNDDKSKKNIPKDINEYRLLEDWFRLDSEFHSQQKEFRGAQRNRIYSMPQIVHSVMRGVKNTGDMKRRIPQVLRNYDIYHVLTPEYLYWPLRWTHTFFQKFRAAGPRAKDSFLNRIIKLQMGIFEGMRAIRVGPIKYHFIASLRLEYDQTLIFGVFPERVPQYHKGQQFILDLESEHIIEKGPQIWGYFQRQVIVLLDLVKSDKSLEAVLRKGKVPEYLARLEKDPDRWGCFMLHREALDDEEDDQIYDRRVHLILQNCFRNRSIQVKAPLLLGKITLKQKIIDKMEYDYDLHRFIIPSDKSIPTGESHNDFNYFRERVLNKFADASNARWLVSFLESIPNFRLKLTEEEKDTIGQTGNVLALGRSGTGKTTCSVLRLFATEVLFKVRVRSLIKEQQQEPGKFSYEDLGMKCGLNMIFVTASPVLTIEVKRFYESLKERVKEELRKRKERRLEKMRKKQFEEIKASQASEQKPAQEEEKLEGSQEELKQEKELDIKLDEIRQEEQNLADELDLEQQMTIAPTLSLVDSDDFPLFLTIRRLLFMVDGCFYRSFFVRNQKGEIIGQNTSSQWHNETKGVMLINRYFKAPKTEVAVSKDLANLNQILESESESQSESEGDEEEKKEKKPTKRIHFNRKKAFQTYSMEVDYDVYVNRIWPVIRMRGRPYLTPSLVWGEIVNRIKGSAQTHTYSAGYVHEHDYLREYARNAPNREISKNSNELCIEDYKDIFEIVMRYERWKVREGAFDFCDVVNHILQNIQLGDMYRGPPIHFMMCDEVQDLPPATLLLLIRLSEHCFFSGDSAQTIAKGVGFRFSQLKNLFRPVQNKAYNQNIELPTLHQLSINFRSHGKILDLANSLIKIIELGYPNTIDKLKREVSWVEGLKPMVLQSQLLDCLFGVLVGSEALSQDQQESQGAGLIAKPPVEFGCDQVVIVRDQKSKHNLPSILSHALCLTVYEAKGLEFDDVILFNFFSNSSLTKKQWELLEILGVRQIEYTEKEAKDTLNFQTKESLISKYGVKTTVQKRPKDVEEIAETVVNMEEILKKRRQEDEQTDLEDLLEEDERSFHTMTQSLIEVEKKNQEYRLEQAKNLCTELKELYVACTRARKRLIVFDEDPANRVPLLNLWEKLEVIETVTKEDIYGNKERDEQEKGKKYISRIAVETPKSAWKIQGVKMFKRKFYEAALHCFKKAEQPELERRSLAYVKAERGSQMQTEAEDVRLEVDPRIDSKAKVSAARARSQQIARQALQEFAEAGRIFAQLNLQRQSAQCFYSAHRFREAADGFKAIDYSAQAAECQVYCGNYGEAGELYLKAGVHLKAIDMFMNEQAWEKVLYTIKAAKDVLNQNEIFTLVQKYTPLALSHLYEELSSKDEELKAASVSEIKEEEDEDQEDNQVKSQSLFKIEVLSEEEEENKSEQEEEKKSEQEELKQSKDEAEGMSDFTLVDSVDLEVTSAVAPQSSASFVSVHKSELESSEYTLVDQTEHLSHIDPSDEFINSDGHSVVDEVIQKGARSISSYSFIEDQDIDAGTLGGGAIRTHRDLYAQDQMIQQFVQYISLISDDVQNLMDQHRSKQAKLQVASDSSKQTFLLDVDQIDSSFIELILNTLENFELYSFCLVICNRYQFSSNIGRYLVSLAYKYSNIYEFTTPLLSNLIRSTSSQKQEEVSAIAHAAVHNVFSRIDPRYLRLKRVAEHMNQHNSLGFQTYRALWRLGYWKKLIFIMDIRASLCLLASMGDMDGFNQVYKLGFGSDAPLTTIAPDSTEITVFQEQALVFYFRKANANTLRSKDYILDKSLSAFFPITSSFWASVSEWHDSEQKSERLVLNILKVMMQQCLPVLKKLNRDKPMKHKFRNAVLTAWDCFTCIADFVELLNNSELKSIRSDLMKSMLSYQECHELLLALFQIASIFSKEQKKVSIYADIALGSFGELQHCSILEDSWLFDDDQESVLVSKESPLLNRFLSRQNRLIERQKRLAHQHVVQKYGNLSGKSKKSVEKKLREEAEQDSANLNTQPLMRLADLEGQKVLVPQRWLAQTLQSQVVAFSRLLITSKLKTMVPWPRNEDELGANELDASKILVQYLPDYLEESQLNERPEEEEKKETSEEEAKQTQENKALSSVYCNGKELLSTSRAYYFAYSLYELLSRFYNLQGISLFVPTIWNMVYMYREVEQLKTLRIEARERRQLIQDLSKDEMRYANRMYSSNIHFNALSRKKKLGIQKALGVAGHVSKAGELIQKQKVVYAGVELIQMVKLANRMNLFGETKSLPNENQAIELAQHYWASAIEALEQDLLSKAYTRGLDSYAGFFSATRCDILADLLRTFNFKQIRYLDIERSRCSHFYNTMMTLMDASVYFSIGAWTQAASSLLQFLKATTHFLKLKLQSILLEKVVALLLPCLGSSLHPDIIMLEKQLHSLPGISGKQPSALDMIEYSVTFEREIYEHPKAPALIPGIIDFGLKIITKQQDNIIETHALGSLLNSLVLLALNMKELPAKQDLYQCFEYAIENGYLATQVCENYMTAIQTRTMPGLRAQLLASSPKNFIFSTGRDSLRLVRVRFVLKKPAVPLGKMLDKLFLEESKLVAAHAHSSRIIKKRIEIDRKLLRGIKGATQYEIVPRLARRAREWEVERSALNRLFKEKKDLVAVLGRLGKIKVGISNMLFSSALPSALDLHYLLNRGGEVLRKEENMLEQIKDLLVNKSAEVSYGSVREWLKVAQDSLSTWKGQKFTVSKASLEHRRKILKLKWREHRIHQAQNALKRRKGRGKQDKLAKKKERLLRQKQSKNEPSKVKRMLQPDKTASS